MLRVDWVWLARQMRTDKATLPELIREGTFWAAVELRDRPLITDALRGALCTLADIANIDELRDFVGAQDLTENQREGLMLAERDVLKERRGRGFAELYQEFAKTAARYLRPMAVGAQRSIRRDAYNLTLDVMTGKKIQGQAVQALALLTDTDVDVAAKIVADKKRG